MAYSSYDIESFMSDPIYNNIFIHVFISRKEEDERTEKTNPAFIYLELWFLGKKKFLPTHDFSCSQA